MRVRTSIKVKQNTYPFLLKIEKNMGEGKIGNLRLADANCYIQKG